MTIGMRIPTLRKPSFKDFIRRQSRSTKTSYNLVEWDNADNSQTQEDATAGMTHLARIASSESSAIATHPHPLNFALPSESSRYLRPSRLVHLYTRKPMTPLCCLGTFAGAPTLEINLLSGIHISRGCSAQDLGDICEQCELSNDKRCSSSVDQSHLVARTCQQ